eukprot:maker-scaffold1195_size56104-snap-gene-0.17 protein:Tk12023 transcript:maker-scaffold1195_size56104-snap-gene-0.17-mRNA-1 annotation:"hypothetical protein LOTGIDRAFT_236773"
MVMGSVGAIFLLWACSSFHSVEGNCKTSDAKWIKGKDLLITQPSRTDPSKVSVVWTNMVENERCVDEFYVWAWKKGLEKKNGTKYTVSKSVFSKEVAVDPCVEYNFQVELMENDLFGADMEESKVTLFKPSAVAKILDTDKKNFYVGYDYDRVKGVHDLSTVAIRFKKSILQNPSCVKYIEITGQEVPEKARSFSLSGRTRTTPYLEELAPNYGIDGQFPSLNAGRGRSSGSSGSSGAYGSSGVSDSTGSAWSSNNYKSGSSGQSDYHSAQKGRPGYSYTSYSSVTSGSSGSSGSHSSSSGSRSSQPDSDSKGSNSYPWSSGGYPSSSWGNNRKKRGLFSSSETTTTSRPTYGGGAPTGPPSGKALPPFNHDIIEVNAKIQPCKSYKFTMTVMTPSGSVLGEIKDLQLPHLTEMTDYRPPMLSKVFRVEHIINKGPIIKLQPGWGVPAACLGDFFEAVDAHVADLESDLKYHIQQVSQAVASSDNLKNNLRLQKSAQLTQFGCKCNATQLNFNTTDASDFEKSREIFGVYQFEDMIAGKPYFRRLHSSLAPSGRPSIGSSTTESPVKKKLGHETVYFMYWNTKENNWAIGATMDGEDIQFKTKENSVAKCPGDPNATKTWERSGTFTWHDEPLIKAACGLAF